jgi:hypothetical protein
MAPWLATLIESHPYLCAVSVFVLYALAFLALWVALPWDDERVAPTDHDGAVLVRLSKDRRPVSTMRVREDDVAAWVQYARHSGYGITLTHLSHSSEASHS